MNLPFSETKKEDLIFRTFSPEIDSDELVWHKDLNDRIVTIIESGGWQFQKEDELPITLTNNQVLLIPKNSWHRVIKGKSELKIKIIEKKTD
jgi:quercetin dioxygenase-like cupin family protein